MKQPWEWDEEDIEELIREGVQESLTLEYKRCASLDRRYPNRRSEMSKDISAFANSAGGTIVYGIAEVNHLPTNIDIGYDPQEITREWLEQVINSTIQRKIDGIRIKQIELKKSNPGRVIYVVYIPQSKRAPHMGEDHVFYKRYNYQSIPMEEYEVRDVSRRDEAPDLQLRLFLAQADIKIVFGEDSEFSVPIPINAIISNQSSTPAMYYVSRIFVHPLLQIVSKGEFQEAGIITIEVGQIKLPMNVLSLNCGIPGKMPIWQGTDFRISSSNIELAIPKKHDEGNYVVAWSVSSPGMSQRMDYVLLQIQDQKVSLTPLKN